MLELCLALSITVVELPKAPPQILTTPIAVMNPEQAQIWSETMKNMAQPKVSDDGLPVLAQTWDCVQIPSGNTSAP